jgi:HlyD family secretion protein
MKLTLKGLLIGAAGIVLVAGGALLILKNGPLRAIEVTQATVEKSDLRPQIFGIGTIEARRSYLIGPTQAARVTRVLVDQGETVKAGQLLAELDAVDLDERASSASSAVLRAQANVTGAEAQVRETASRSALASASAKRFRELQQKSFVSPEAADAKQHEANAAAAALDSAKAALAAAQRDAARLGADRAGIGKQRSQFRLVSPIEGLVTAREGEPGSTVIAGQAVLRLIDPHSLWVKARFDQSRAAGLKVGQAARIVLRSQPQAPLGGRVARLETGSDSVTEERLVNIGFDQMPAGLTTGELAEATVDLPPIKGVLSMPGAALHRLGQQTGVWRIADGKTAFVPVRVGIQTLDGRAQVLEGLKEGDLVIEHAPVELRAGQRVRAVKILGVAGS